MTKGIAIQGLSGSYTEMAAREICPQAELTYIETFDGVFDAVREGKVSRAVVAFSNNRIGPIRRPTEILTGHGTMNDFWIDGGVTIPINHSLSALPGVRIKEVKEVITQAEAFNQCRQFTRGLPSDVKLTEGRDTALSAQKVADSNRHDFAAICSEGAACMYGLEPIQTAIQDDSLNLTRFVSFITLGNGVLRDQDPDNTIATLTLRENIGSLEESLAVFKSVEIDIRSLRSRPIPNTPKEVDMVIEINAGIKDDRMPEVIKDLAISGGVLTVIGSYRATRSIYEKSITDKEFVPEPVDVEKEVQKYHDLVKTLTAK